MLIKTDENLPPIIASNLCALGHDATTVLAQGMGGKIANCGLLFKRKNATSSQQIKDLLTFDSFRLVRTQVFCCFVLMKTGFIRC